MEKNSTTGTREALVKDVDSLKQDATSLKKDATKIVQDVKAHATAHVDETKKRIQDAVSSAQAQAAAHPLAILGIGIALGYVFGARRRHRRS